ncbi:MAG: AbrB/MazE/SpoVT family DNA-binding domain-containing protein [Bacillota bacterium]
MLTVEQSSHKFRMGKKGLIALPTQVKRSLNISPGDYLEMYVEDEAIVMRLPKNAAGFSQAKGLELIAK